MPDDARQITATNTRDLATMPFTEALESYTPNFVAALPSHIPIERFKRMVVTAVNQNPDLIRADRRTLFNACVKCAHDGLFPDGREAALVTFRTKIKQEGQERWIDAVQYLPMVAGIRKRMRNTGDVLSAEAHVVYRNDRFHREFGDNPSIAHEPPPIDRDRGDPVGAYAIIKLKNGEVLREVMSLKEIEKVRAVSRTATTKGAPWTEWWDEMARKTVLKRCAKAAPNASDLERLIGEEEAIETPRLEDLAPVPPRPQRADYVEHDIVVPSGAYFFVDLDGVEHEESDANAVHAAMFLLVTDAERRGPQALAGLRESNELLLTALRNTGHGAIARALEAALAPEPAGAAPAPESAERTETAPKPEMATAAPPAATTPATGQGGVPETAIWYDRPDLTLELPVRHGKPDWDTWLHALLLPKLRGTAITAHLAKLLGDNAAHIETCKLALGLEGTTELNAAISQQWARIPADS